MWLQYIDAFNKWKVQVMVEEEMCDRKKKHKVEEEDMCDRKNALGYLFQYLNCIIMHTIHAQSSLRM